MAKKDWMIIESELDEDQIKVLMATNEKSCVVSGCAGSGKSVLALIKAQRIQKEKGNDYQIIVYTKALARYMNEGRNFLELTNHFSYHWYWKNRLDAPSSDYIIVDEIQDFTEDEIQSFIKSSNKNFFFFGDTAQSIYGGIKKTMPVDEISSLLARDRRPKVFELYRNYRLPKPVARIVQYVGVDLDGFDEDTYKSQETAVPRIIHKNTFEDQIEAIVDKIERISINGTKDILLSDVGILVPTNEDVKRVSLLLDQHGVNHEMKYDDKKDYHNSILSLNFTTTNPKVMTYHSAKGLQFESVFLPGISELSYDTERRISDQKALYVAMTRTYRNLFVLYSGVLPEPLSDIPTHLYKTTETDIIEDI